MASRKNLYLTSLFLVLHISSAASRVTPDEQTLPVRLQAAGGGATECWEALLELRACTGEVILFFLNGEAYLGPACCRAIRVIEHSCWPAMLAALGFTREEGDILRGYCDATDASPPPPPPPASGPSPVHSGRI